jgi:CubicO group peptidase (beta-lactamase class C family)
LRTLKEYLVSEALQNVIGYSSDDLCLEFFCLSKQGAFRVVRSGNSVTIEHRVLQPDCTTVRSWPFASVSKPVVSQMAYRAAAEGLLNLDQSAADALNLKPEHLNSQVLSQIRVRHLFSHTSGLPPEADQSLWTTLRFPTDVELVQAFCQAEVRGKPGDQIRYSNFGFSLGALILQSVTKRTVQELWTEFAAKESRFAGINFSRILGPVEK